MDDDDDDGYFDDDDASFLQAAVAVVEQTESVLDRSYANTSKRPFDLLQSNFSSSVSKKPRIAADSDPPPNLPGFIVNDAGQYSIVPSHTPAVNLTVPGWSFQSKEHSTPSPEGSKFRAQQQQTHSLPSQTYSSVNMTLPGMLLLIAFGHCNCLTWFAAQVEPTYPAYGSQSKSILMTSNIKPSVTAL